MNKFLTVQLFISSWNGFYRDAKDLVTISKQDTGLLEPGDGKPSINFHIFDCNFKDLSNNEFNKGACIFVDLNSKYYNTLIEDCTFNNCVAKEAGGALWIKAKGNSVLSRICATKCRTEKDLMFGYIERVNDGNNIFRNEIYQSTISSCRFKDDIENTQSDHVLKLFNGEIKCNELNGSQCYCWFSMFYFVPSENHNKYTVETTYSTFADNKNKQSILIGYVKDQNIGLISRCNVIRNVQDDKKNDYGEFDGLILAPSFNLVIEDTCIAKNTAKCLIDVNGNEENGILGSLILRNVYIDKDDINNFINNNRNDKTVETELIPKTAFINGIMGYEKNECHASFDVLKHIICFNKELNDPPVRVGLFGMALTILMLPKDTVPVETPPLGK